MRELEESILLHLLAHRGHQVRFEADRAVTELGILRAFEARGLVVRRALADLESNRWVVRRMQYVVGYSEPKVVYTLTPIGHQRAQTLLSEESRTVGSGDGRVGGGAGSESAGSEGIHPGPENGRGQRVLQ